MLNISLRNTAFIVNRSKILHYWYQVAKLLSHEQLLNFSTKYQYNIYKKGHLIKNKVITNNF